MIRDPTVNIHQFGQYNVFLYKVETKRETLFFSKTWKMFFAENTMQRKQVENIGSCNLSHSRGDIDRCSHYKVFKFP